LPNQSNFGGFGSVKIGISDLIQATWNARYMAKTAYQTLIPEI
jgi:hypothetical protein